MKGYAITLDDIPLSYTLLFPMHNMCKLGSAYCLTYVTQSFGGHQKIVWRSPKDCLAFANRSSGICHTMPVFCPIIKEKEEKSEAVSNKSTPC